MGFPAKMTITHKYAETVNMTSTTSSFATYFFTCNGLYDPNLTGTGHQPLYFDQMSTLYNHYTVVGSRIKVRTAPNTSAEDMYFMGCYINDDAVNSYTDSSGVIENVPGASTVIVPNNSNDLYTLTQNWSAAKAFGARTGIIQNTSLAGSASGNPAESQTFCICCQAINAATVTVTLFVEIEYITVWTERKEIAQS